MRKTSKVLTPKRKRNQCRWKIFCRKLTPAASRSAQKLGCVRVPDEFAEALPFAQFGGRRVVLLLRFLRHVTGPTAGRKSCSVLCFLTRRRLTGKSGSGPGRSISVQSSRAGPAQYRHHQTYDYYAQIFRHTLYARRRSAHKTRLLTQANALRVAKYANHPRCIIRLITLGPCKIKKLHFSWAKLNFNVWENGTESTKWCWLKVF